MLKPDECLVWDGAEFRPVPLERPILPQGARLMRGPVPAAKVNADALRSFAQAMQVNPQISAYLAAGMEMYGYRVGEDEELYNIMLEYQSPFAPGFAPSFREFDGLGMAFGSRERRWSIYVKLGECDILCTLYHELFHTIYRNIPRKYLDSLEEFGALIRENNNDVYHPDSRSVRWIYSPEEAEAFAFERFATGNPMPFGLALPSPVRATFKAVLRGDYAHHRVLPR